MLQRCSEFRVSSFGFRVDQALNPRLGARNVELETEAKKKRKQLFMRKKFYRAHLMLALATLLLPTGLAQSQDNGRQTERSTSAGKEASVKKTQAAGPQESKSSGINRWLEISSLLINARYRFIQTTEGVTTISHLQYRDSLVARLKLDEKGRYSINAGMHTVQPSSVAGTRAVGDAAATASPIIT